MSDKPEKIYMRDDGEGYLELTSDTDLNKVEYIRADLAKASEWISVATPPEYNVPVLVYNPGWDYEMVAKLCQTTRSIAKDSPKDDRWYAIPGWGHELKPTVWHELPLKAI